MRTKWFPEAQQGWVSRRPSWVAAGDWAVHKRPCIQSSLPNFPLARASGNPRYGAQWEVLGHWDMSFKTPETLVSFPIYICSEVNGLLPESMLPAQWAPKQCGLWAEH